MEYLMIQLIAPMGAFGLAGGHEYRRSAHYPTRSALIGLAGAALGVLRCDKEGQGALRALSTAIALYRVGTGLRDFHTMETIPAARIKHPRTRAHALKELKPSDNATSITRRDYVTDCAYTAAFWRRSDNAPPLSQLALAFKKPTFVPYMGRKSCPLSHPMNPVLLDAEDAKAALMGYHSAHMQHLNLPLHMISAEELSTYDTLEWMIDDPIDRERWHFQRRPAYIVYPAGEAS